MFFAMSIAPEFKLIMSNLVLSDLIDIGDLFSFY